MSTPQTQSFEQLRTIYNRPTDSVWNGLRPTLMESVFTDKNGDDLTAEQKMLYGAIINTRFLNAFVRGDGLRVLRDAKLFVDRHCEPDYITGQNLFASLSALIDQLDGKSP